MIHLVDKSVLARRHLPVVRNALLPLVSSLAVCAPTILEMGWSARNRAHYDAMTAELNAFQQLQSGPDCWAVAQDIQGRLVNRGHHRGPGVPDLLIAATALQHDAVVLHYDRDYELIAEVEPNLRQRWIVARGSTS